MQLTCEKKILINKSPGTSIMAQSIDTAAGVCPDECKVGPAAKA